MPNLTGPLSERAKGVFELAVNLPVFGIPSFGTSAFGIPVLGISLTSESLALESLSQGESQCGFSLPSELSAFGIPVFGIPTFGIPAFGVPTFGISVEFRHLLIRHPLDSPQPLAFNLGVNKQHQHGNRQNRRDLQDSVLGKTQGCLGVCLSSNRNSWPLAMLGVCFEQYVTMKSWRASLMIT